jgi:hypothetical protein
MVIHFQADVRVKTFGRMDGTANALGCALPDSCAGIVLLKKWKRSC